MNSPFCSDYNNIKAAYEAMKNVACLINERKRKLESIDKIARWQVSIVGWEVSGTHVSRVAHRSCTLVPVTASFSIPCSGFHGVRSDNGLCSQRDFDKSKSQLPYLCTVATKK